MSLVCVINNNFGLFFVHLQELPLLIGAGLTAITYFTGSPFFAAAGFYLYIMSWFLYPFQTYFNITRNPLLCPLGSAAYEFPSMEAFYITSLVTMVIWYRILFKGRPTKLAWGGVFLAFAIPTTALLFFQFNVWYEVLMSAGIAVFTTSVFMLHMAYMWSDSLPYLEHVPPCSTFGYKDDLGWAERDDSYHEKRQELHKILHFNHDKWRTV